MFKSEIANRIISLIGWIIVVFVLFSNNTDTVSDSIFWIIVVVFTACHLYGIINALKKSCNG